MNDLPAILFPHAHIPESSARKILSFFGPLSIFEPWFMEKATSLWENDYPESIRVMHPPRDLRPGEGFKALLSEYRTWIKFHGDRSYTEFLKASQGEQISGSATWQIRQMLRQVDQEASSPEKDPIARWHLVLHLAQEAEEERREAGRMLKVLKEKGSPLKAVMEESDHVDSLLSDLPDFERDAIGGEHQLRQVLEAWFGLFGAYVKGNELLITRDRKVADYVSETWKDLSHEGKTTFNSVVSFKVPDLSEYPIKALVEKKKEYYHGDRITELRNLILNLGNDPAHNTSTLKRLLLEVAPSLRWGPAKRALNITVQHLSPLVDHEYAKIDRVMAHLSNRTIIMMEADSRHE